MCKKKDKKELLYDVHVLKLKSKMCLNWTEQVTENIEYMSEYP
jgi:hypothetical protein